ncbi:MAG: hypothetical protein JNM18_22860 [Planctomycetaceae bacterium]|nr:hypothetical protein [Planctomycetaceae bacterium]
MIRAGWLFVALLLLVTTAVQGEIVVDTQFENASAIVEAIDQTSQTIRFTPGGDPRRGWPCWWSFKVRGLAPGREVTLSIAPNPGKLPSETGVGIGSEGKPLALSWSIPQHAFYSVDGGQHWLQTDAGSKDDTRFVWRKQIDTAEAWFAWGPVFSVSDGAALVKRLDAESEWAEEFTLATSREGRRAPALRVHQSDSKRDPPRAIWIQARQHAWESGASWVGRGFAEWLVSDDPLAESLRRKAEIYYVPVMDIDNVATGNGGKGQSPWDHNRDWSDKPEWPEVAAAQQQILRLHRDGRFAVFVDLHNPGPGDKAPFYMTVPRAELSELGRRNLDRFITFSAGEITGPLKFSPTPHESGAAYSNRWREISKNWVQFHTGEGTVAVTLETAWNTPESTADNYRTVGRQLGLTIERYLRAD